MLFKFPSSEERKELNEVGCTMPVTETQIKMGYCPILFFVLTAIVFLPLLFTLSLLFQWHLAAQIILWILASALVLFVTVLFTDSFAGTEGKSNVKDENFGTKPDSELEKKNVDNRKSLQIVNVDTKKYNGAPTQSNLNLNVMSEPN